MSAITESETRTMKLERSMPRNWAASAPQWRAIWTARSLVTRAEGPGMPWSLRSLTSRKRRRQDAAPTAEMLRRYWMFPYHAAGSSASGKKGGGADREPVAAGDMAGGKESGVVIRVYGMRGFPSCRRSSSTFLNIDQINVRPPDS
ncbi:hypothetical protein M5K25_007596 [Dendrobium thyrsiflorum]|uniref:Uncharacterized protein n=1 Tax=Dendrobium thyrsiflorum TaxID=117978 RepID=A0ABD0VER4_DENTH